MPANLEVASEFRPIVLAMLNRSTTFRRQCDRVAAVAELRVRLLEDESTGLSSARARTHFTFRDGRLGRADIFLRRSNELVELIAHEMEHVIEQLDGIELGLHAGDGAAWRSGDDSYETTRAVEAGHRAAVEFTGRKGEPARKPSLSFEPTRVASSSSPPRVSPLGRYVAFVSSARLVAEDVDDRRDVYVRDLDAGVTTLETSTHSGTDSESADISGDGRYLVFASTFQIFLRDRTSGTTRLLTRNAAGQPANRWSGDPVISADGSTVAFESAATDLPGASMNGNATSVVVLDLATGVFRRVGETDAMSYSPSLSGDGRYVAFTSKQHLRSDVYVFDAVAGMLKKVTVSAEAADCDGPTYHPAISSNGRYIAFVSEASNLSHASGRRIPQIYVHDLRSGTTELVSRTPGGRPGNAASMRPSISEDGAVVAFQSLASDLVCDHACRGTERDINLLWDIFVSDRNTGRIVRASVDSAGEWMESSTAPSIDARGRVVAFVTRHLGDDPNGEAVYVLRPLR